jgi:hypothetical protein
MYLRQAIPIAMSLSSDKLHLVEKDFFLFHTHHTTSSGFIFFFFFLLRLICASYFLPAPLFLHSSLFFIPFPLLPPDARLSPLMPRLRTVELLPPLPHKFHGVVRK